MVREKRRRSFRHGFTIMMNHPLVSRYLELRRREQPFTPEA